MPVYETDLEYRVSLPPALDRVEDVLQWAVAELTRVQNAVSLRHRLPVLNNAPDKVFTGMLVYADGTNWNPGSGEGAYVYTSGGSWSKL